MALSGNGSKATKAPSTSIQLQRTTKVQTPRPIRSFVWMLMIEISLELGAWNLRLLKS
jgi:hypothetical protein